MFFFTLLQPHSAPAPYGQSFSGPAVPTSSLFPTQQSQTAAKPFISPTVPNLYPANSATRPSVQQPFVPTTVPPKPFSPAPVVSGVSQPHGGFMNPGQPGIPPAPSVSASPGKFLLLFIYICRVRYNCPCA